MDGPTNKISYTDIAQAVQSWNLTREKIIFSLILERAYKTNKLVNLRFSDFENKHPPISRKLLQLIRTYKKQNGFSKTAFILSSRERKQISKRRLHQIIRTQTKKSFGIHLNSENLRILTIEEQTKQAQPTNTTTRLFLNEKQQTNIQTNINTQRDLLLFKLLTQGIGPKKICNLTFKETTKLDINETTKQLIKKYKEKNEAEEHDYLFTTRQHSHLTKERIFQIVQGWKKSANIQTLSPRILMNTHTAKTLYKQTKKHVERRKGQGIITYQQVT